MLLTSSFYDFLYHLSSFSSSVFRQVLHPLVVSLAALLTDTLLAALPRPHEHGLVQAEVTAYLMKSQLLQAE